MSNIKVFVGSENKTKVAFEVLKYTIEKNTADPVEVIEMGDFEPWLVPKDVHQATGFSLRRWMIPEVCEYDGVAIYMDADQIVFGNVRQLHDYYKNGKTITCCYRKDKCSQMLAGRPDAVVPQTSVMVINCSMCKREEWSREVIFGRIRNAGKPHTKEAVREYQKIMHGGLISEEPYPLFLGWNEFNEYRQTSQLLHYTYEKTQCWYHPGTHPLSALWEAELIKAIAAGCIKKDIFEEALALGEKGSNDWREHGGLHSYFKKYLPLF